MLNLNYKIMNKKIFSGIAIVAIALTLALNVSFSAKNNNLSDISLANIEALGLQEEGQINCCPDELDTCVVGSTSVSDYDEC